MTLYTMYTAIIMIAIGRSLKTAQEISLTAINKSITAIKIVITDFNKRPSIYTTPINILYLLYDKF